MVLEHQAAPTELVRQRLGGPFDALRGLPQDPGELPQADRPVEHETDRLEREGQVLGLAPGHPLGHPRAADLVQLELEVLLLLLALAVALRLALVRVNSAELRRLEMRPAGGAQHLEGQLRVGTQPLEGRLLTAAGAGRRLVLSHSPAPGSDRRARAGPPPPGRA